MRDEPLDDAPENHWSWWTDPEDDDYVPPQVCGRVEILDLWGLRVTGACEVFDEFTHERHDEWP